MTTATDGDREGAPVDPRGARERAETAERLGISSKKVGLAPGAVVFTGTRHVDEASVSTLTYTEHEVRETDDADIGTLRLPTSADDGVQWVNVVGLHDTALIVAIGERYGLHPLLLEDVTGVRSRPSFIDYEHQAFLSLKMLTWAPDERVDVEHISLVLGDDYVIAFQERPGDVFDSVRTRIRTGTTRIRRRDAEYLWYALIDAVVDHYLLVMEELASRVDRLEERVWNGDPDGNGDVPSDVQALRAEMSVVRRALRPLREEIERLAKEPPEWFSEEIGPILKTHCVHCQ